LYSVLRRVLAPRKAAWTAALLFVFPPVMLPFAAIWKDSVMAAFLMLGLAGLLDPRRGMRIAGLAALVIATAVRYNAFAATFPLVVLLFEWRPAMHWLQRYAIAVVAWAVVTLSAFQLNSALTVQPMHFWHSSLATYDIIGTLAKLDAELPDAEIERALAGTGLLVHDHLQARARVLFDPGDFSTAIVAGPRRFWDLPTYGNAVVPEATREAIERAWREIILRHPGAYLRYRVAVMAAVLSILRTRPPGAVPWRHFNVNAFAWAQAIPTRVSAYQRWATFVMLSLWRYTPIFWPWIYLLLALAMCGLAVTTRQREPLALCVSGLALEATLFFLAPTRDYRYSHWMVVASCLAAVLARVHRAQLGSRRATAGTAGADTSTGTSTGLDSGLAASNPSLQPTT
jgi:hypothetical protein